MILKNCLSVNIHRAPSDVELDPDLHWQWVQECFGKCLGLEISMHAHSLAEKYFKVTNEERLTFLITIEAFESEF